MEKPIISELNAVTNKVTTREMTDDEYAVFLETIKDVQPLGAANDD